MASFQAVKKSKSASNQDPATKLVFSIAAGILITAVFIWFTYATIKARYDSFVLDRHHQSATAVVVDKDIAYSSRTPDSYLLTAAYRPVGSQSRQVVKLEVTKKYYYRTQITESIPIVYDPTLPSRVRTADRTNTQVLITTGMYGAFALLVTIFTLVVTIVLIVVGVALLRRRLQKGVW